MIGIIVFRQLCTVTLTFKSDQWTIRRGFSPFEFRRHDIQEPNTACAYLLRQNEKQLIIINWSELSTIVHSTYKFIITLTWIQSSNTFGVSCFRIRVFFEMSDFYCTLLDVVFLKLRCFDAVSVFYFFFVSGGRG